MSASLFTLRGLLGAMTPADRVLCLGLVVAAWLAPSLARQPADGPLRAVVTVGREQVAVIPLGTDGVSSVRGRLGDVRLEVSGGAIRVVESPCLRHLCVASGAKRRPGEIIACVPNELLVRIAGEPSPDVPDAVTR